MQTALQRAIKGEARVVPVILRACVWESSRFASLEVLPQDGKPVTSWSNRDEAWNSVAHGIKQIVENIRGRDV